MIFGRFVERRDNAHREPVVRYAPDRLRRPFGLARTARAEPKETEVRSALAKLGLAGSYYGPLDLCDAVHEHLGLSLKVLVVEDQLWCKRMLKEGVRGAIRLYEDTDRGELLVPGDLDREELAEVMYHELAHVIAAHTIPLRRRPGDEPGRVRLWLPQKRLTSRRPPFDLAACERDHYLRRQLLHWCEDDADSWAEHLRVFGAYGPRAYFRENMFLAP